jgi:hypothetical protein
VALLYRGAFDDDFCPSITFKDGVIADWWDQFVADEVDPYAPGSTSSLKAAFDDDLFLLITANDGIISDWFDPWDVVTSLVSATGTVSIAGDANYTTTGVAATSAVGTVSVTADANPAPTGNQATSASGSVSVTGGASVSPSGSAATSTAGSASVTGDSNVSPTGTSATTLSGSPSVAADANTTSTGQAMASAVGNVTVTTAIFDVTVNLVGIGLSASIGNVVPILPVPPYQMPTQNRAMAGLGANKGRRGR